MRILVDGRVWSRNAAGITSFLTGALLTWAEQQPADTFFVLLPKGLDASIELPPLPENVRLLDYGRRFPSFLPNIIILQLVVPSLCRRQDIDLYFSPVPHLPACLPRKVRTLVTVHDVVNLEMAETMAWTNRLATQRFFSRAVQNADFLWTNSRYTKKKVEQYFPERKCKPIFVGDAIDRDLYYPRHLSEAEKTAVRERFGIHGRFLLFVGSLEPRKNIPFLLELVRKSYGKIGAQLVVVGGKGWKNTSIREIVEDSSFPRESTVFCGYVTKEDLALLYNTADCFVSASRMEGLGLPQIEALACSCPIVTADNTAMTEVAEGKQGAYLVQGYDEAQWLATILHVLDEQPKVDPTQLEEYRWENVISGLKEYLEKK